MSRSGVFRGVAVVDFIKLYIVLVFIPVAAVAVPALLTWARDFNASARRIRRLDELIKVVSFWDGWMKTTATLVPTEGRRIEKTESYISTVINLARHDLADAGGEALAICKWGQYEELGKYELDFAAFQKFRAGLPWYRRAFLLYRTPNRRVRIPKTLFYMTLLLLPLNLFVSLGGHIVPSGLRSLEPWPFPGLHAFAAAHPVLSAVFDWAYLVGFALFNRREAIKFENDRRCYVQDRFWKRLGFTEEDGAPAKAREQESPAASGADVSAGHVAQSGK
jgi:hypothetical protein